MWQDILKTNEDISQVTAYLKELHGKYGTEYKDHSITSGDAVYQQFDSAYKNNKAKLISEIRYIWNNNQASVMADAEGIQGNYLISL